MSDIKLRLNIRAPNEEASASRVKDAVKRKKAATETIEEAFDRVSDMKLSDKERQLFNIAKDGYFSGVIGRLSGGKLNKGEVLAMGRQLAEQSEAKERKRRITETLENKPSNYYILTDDADLPSFIGRVREECQLQAEQWRDRFEMLGVNSMTAGDFEGTGIDSYIDLSIGFSIWLPILKEGYYLAYGHVDMRAQEGFEFLTDESAFKEGDAQLTRSKALQAITPYLSHEKHGKTFHMGSARYDLHIAINDGYEIRGCVWDTLDAMRNMNEHEEKYGLKPLIQKYGKAFGIEGDVLTFEDLFGNRSPAPFNTELVGIYAINDVKYGWSLFEWQFEIMAKRDRLLYCYATIDSKLPETDVFMERCGFVIDLEGLRKLESEFSEKVTEARRKVFETYRIDAEFIRKMDRTISATKIRQWVTAQEKRIATKRKQIETKRNKLAEYEAQGKTHLKAYQNEKDMLAKYKLELSELAEPTEENAPQYVDSFELTNGNHIAYLIYDHLGIEDKTYKIDRGKKRSTAADVLAIYYEDEPTLEPLAIVAEYEKLLNTYVRKIPEAMEIDGRFHSNFKAGGTATGRYSSSAYNGRPIDILDEFKEVLR